MSNQFVQLKDNGNNLFPKTLAIGIDTSNILFTKATNDKVPITYTATEDCICFCITPIGSDSETMLVDNVVLFNWFQAFVEQKPVSIYLKKGQVLYLGTYNGRVNTSLKVYGLKYI